LQLSRRGRSESTAPPAVVPFFIVFVKVRLGRIRPCKPRSYPRPNWVSGAHGRRTTTTKASSSNNPTSRTLKSNNEVSQASQFPTIDFGLCRTSCAAGLVVGCDVGFVESLVGGRVAVAPDNKCTPGEHWMGDQDGRIPRTARGIHRYATSFQRKLMLTFRTLPIVCLTFVVPIRPTQRSRRRR
jgi:hypothetical protein